MYLGGFVGLIVVLLAILLIVGVLELSHQLVGGLFLAVALGLFGPFVDRYGRPRA